MMVAQRLSVSTAALPGWDIDRALHTIASCGITDVEVVVGSPTDGFPYDGSYNERLRGALRSNHLALTGVAASGDLPAGHADLANVVSTAEALGAKYVRIFPPRFAEGVPLADQLDQMRDAIVNLCERRIGDGVDVLIELAQDTLVPSPELARRALQPLAKHGVGVLYDPANMLVEGHLSAELAIACLDGLLRHVHVKNQVVTREAGGLRRRFASLRRGGVDWVATLRALDRSGYEGSFTIDHLAGTPSGRRIRQDTRDFAAALSRAWQS
jgi:sugar phosphate isomerase/epimerase